MSFVDDATRKTASAGASFVDSAVASQAPAEPPPPPDVHGSDLVRGRLRALSKGQTFGWSDEIVASLVTGFEALSARSPEEVSGVYEDVRSSEAFMQQQYQAANPKQAMALELGGGILSGAAALRTPAALAPKIPLWLQGAGAGAVAGAVYGAGAAEQGGRTTGGIEGAAVGAVATPVLGAGLRVGGRLIKGAAVGVWRAASKTPAGRAVAVVREALKQSDVTADEAVAMLRELGEGGILADISPTTRSLARASFRDLPMARELATKALTERQRNMGQRVIDIVGKAANNPEAYRAAQQKIAKSMREQAGPLYQAAYRKTIDVTSADMQALLKRPAMMQATKIAKRLAADEGVDISGNVQALDYMQRALFDMANRAKFTTNKGRILMDLRGQLLDALDTVPEFALARSVWRGGKAQQEAAQLGRNIFRGDADDVLAQIADMSGAEQQALRAGVLRAVVEKVKSASDTGNSIKRLTGNQRNREVLEAAFPDGAFDKMLPKLAGEQEKYRTFAEILQGSRTAMIQGESVMADDLLSVVSNSNDVTSAAAKLLRKYGFGDANKETLEEVAKLLFTPINERQIVSLMRQPGKAAAPLGAGNALEGGVAGGTASLTQ